MLNAAELISAAVTFCYPERQKLEVFLKVQPPTPGGWHGWRHLCPPHASPPGRHSPGCSGPCLPAVAVPPRVGEPTSSNTGLSSTSLYANRASPWADFTALSEYLPHAEIPPRDARRRAGRAERMVVRPLPPHSVPRHCPGQVQPPHRERRPGRLPMPRHPLSRITAAGLFRFVSVRVTSSHANKAGLSL